MLIRLVNGFNHTKYLSLKNQCINVYPNEYSQELHYYLFAVKLDMCVQASGLFYKVCVTNKTGDLNLSVFNMITGIIESKTLTMHISSES